MQKKFIPILMGASILLVYPSQLQAQNASDELSSEEMYFQNKNEDNLKEFFRNLSLQGAIEQALRANFNEKARVQNDYLLDLNFEDTKTEFWMPKLAISFVSEEQRIATVKSGNQNSGATSKEASGYIRLGFDDYTLFNWGKDYLQYLNDKQTYERTKEQFKEQKRNLKHNVIIAYFDLLKSKKVEEIARDQLRHASFIYRLNKEKASVKKITAQEFYQARSEYLLAQEAYHNAKNDVLISDENLATLIGDKVGTRYVPEDELNYEKLRLSFNESIQLSEKNNPLVRDFDLAIDLAKRDEEITRRQDLPLPKVSIKLGAYNYTYGDDENSTRYRTGSNNNNVEVVAAINATWALTGRDGILNSRRREISAATKALAFKQKEAAIRNANGDIRNHYKAIQKYQNVITILEANLPTLQKSFDSALENYLNKRVSYNDYHLSLMGLIDARTRLEDARFNHTREKIKLAATIGVEDFPGQNFERLATKVKR